MTRRRPPRKYLTITYVHPRCGWAVTIRTAVPPDRGHHAMTYAQGLSDDRCLRCEQRREIAQCPCALCCPPAAVTP